MRGTTRGGRGAVPLGLTLAALLAAGLAACGPTTPGPATTERLAGALTIEVGDGPAWTADEPAPGLLRLVQTIRPEELVDAGLPGIRRVELALTGRGGAPAGAAERAAAQAEGQRLPGRSDAAAEGADHRLVQGDVELVYVPLPDRLDDASIAAAAAAFPEGGFSVLGATLLVHPPGEGPLTYTATLDPERDPDGLPHLDLEGGSFQGLGVPVGSRATATARWEAGASLRLGLAARGGRGGSLDLVVSVDGTAVGRVTGLPVALDPTARWQTIPLPGTGGTLTLAPAGDAAGEVLVVAPSLTRPRAASPRPDLLVFLADTFRADNLAHAGGDPALTPVLNAWAEGAVTFQRAWSTSSWTLPSQASLLTGLMPLRHGAVYEQLALDERHETLPELLGRAGYRTVAVTEGGFVVPSFGLAQGFEEFVVGPSNDLDATLANLRAVLERGDGRPLFLYLQTFRAHSDYVATDDARAALAGLFAAPPTTGTWDFRALMERIGTDVGDPDFLTPLGTNAVMADEVLAHPALADLERLYRGGSWDVDAGFGAFLALLEEHGLEDAPLVFTSDHGEAFGEHGIAGHGNSAFEEQVRVPLVVRAPGMPPHVSDAPASLLDLGPTLCELADVAVPAHWEGRSLVGELRRDPAAAAARPTAVVAFECPNLPSGLPAEFAVLAGDRKLVGVLDVAATVLRPDLVAYDLAADPGETHPLTLADGPTWVAELADEAERLVARYRDAHYPAQTIQLTPEAEAELRAMGYLGGTEPAPGPELDDEGFPLED